MVSTLDFESSDPSSNLGGTSNIFIASLVVVLDKKYEKYRKYKNFVFVIVFEKYILLPI